MRKKQKPLKFIVIESPYKGNDPNWADVEFNLAFLRSCMKYVFDQGYTPWAGHGLYTQLGVLNDKIPEERKKGINGHISVGRKLCENGEGEIWIFTNLGISDGMIEGGEKAQEAGCAVQNKELPKEIFDTLCKEWGKDPKSFEK